MLGPVPAGERKIVYVKGGSVEGDRVRGRILPGGGDWALTRRDGVLLLDVRLTLQTFDDALIYCTYTGMRHGMDTPQPYFRIQPSFETSDERYRWLTRLIAVGIGERLALGPRYEIYEIL
jgi:hypothetical protein